EPAPVTNAVLPASLMSLPPSLCKTMNHGFQAREFVQGSKALFTPVTGFAHATKGQFDPAPGPVAVDEHLPAAHCPGHAGLPVAVFCPDTGDKPVFGAI